jgi:hypothetical protein
MMPIPDETVVRRVLEKNDRDRRIRLCIERAWEDLKNKYTDRATWRRKSTTRAVMWEHSVEAVLAELGDDNGIKPIPHNDTISFVADDTVFFRLKKAATSLITANVQTPLASLFHRHDAEDLFGHIGYQRVEVVHVFDRFQTALDWIGVVARERNRVLWQFELPQGGASVVTLPQPDAIKPAADSVLRPVKLAAEHKTDEEKK